MIMTLRLDRDIHVHVITHKHTGVHNYYENMHWVITLINVEGLLDH